MRFAALLLVLATLGRAGATDFGSLGPGETTIVPSGGDDCFGTYSCNHDGTFESGYCWNYGGILPPYYGAFGEGFDTPNSNNIICVTIYLTCSAMAYSEPFDIYIWDGGVASPPGEVLAVFPDQMPYSIPMWPSIGENVFEVYGYAPPTGVTVGYWVEYASDVYVAADEDGYGGHPWTNIRPGIGYPTGWQHPQVVWPECRSLGFGIHRIGFSPVASSTWGEIKALYRLP